MRLPGRFVGRCYRSWRRCSQAPGGEWLQRRYKKFRKMGEYSSHFRAAVTREVATLQGRMKHIVRRRSRTAIENGDLDDLMATLPEQTSTG